METRRRSSRICTTSASPANERDRGAPRGCAACAGEIEALRATRRTLAAWTPPELALGFRITREDAPRPAKSSSHSRVVARAAAGVGAGRGGAPHLRRWLVGGRGSQQRAGPGCHAADRIGRAGCRTGGDDGRATGGTDGVARRSRALEQRLGGADASSGPRADGYAGRGSWLDDALMAQVQTLIEESEQRQRRDFTLRMAELAGDIEAQRRVDLASCVSRSGSSKARSAPSCASSVKCWVDWFQSEHGECTNMVRTNLRHYIVGAALVLLAGASRLRSSRTRPSRSRRASGSR